MLKSSAAAHVAIVALIVTSGCVPQPDRTPDTPEQVLVLKQLVTLR